MKSTIVLLLSQPFGRDTSIEVTCAISGEVDGLRGHSCEFATLMELRGALHTAGLSESEMQTPLNVVRCGFPVFMEVGASVARNIGLLTS